MVTRRTVMSTALVMAMALAGFRNAEAQYAPGRPFVELGGPFPNSCSFFNRSGTVGVNPGLENASSGGPIVMARVHYFTFSYYRWVPASPAVSNWWRGVATSSGMLWQEHLPNGFIGRTSLNTPNWMHYFYGHIGSRYTVIVEFQWLPTTTAGRITKASVQATGTCQIFR